NLLLHHHLHKLHLLFPTSIDQPTSSNYQHNPNFTSSTHSNQPHNPKPPLSNSPFWPNPPYPHPNLQTPSYPPPPTPSYLFLNFHTTPGTTPIIFSTSNFSKMSPRPRSNRKSIAFKTPAAAARWRKMMSEGAAPQAPESSRAAPQAPESSRAASPP
ncbi:hypothetical protein LINGRAHAP2_LOCUS20267, partial [Linum grandiflorum]